MRLNHRIALRTDDPFWLDAEPLGLPVDRGKIISVLNITEDHSAWPAVEQLLVAHGSPLHMTNNIFTKSEIDSAHWLWTFAMGHHGYPQPEDDFGYVEQTYDLTDYCPICGIGGVQKAPFRLRSEPKAPHSQFIQLNWVFDELFVRSEARDGLPAAGITGIEYIGPILYRRNQPSEKVVQMTVGTILPPALDLAGLEAVTCKPDNEESQSDRRQTQPAPTHPHCGRVKYHLMHRGPFRFDGHAFDGAPDVVKSREWFGSGGSAFRLIIVSQKFRQVVTKAKWRGLGFEPIELVDG